MEMNICNDVWYVILPFVSLVPRYRCVSRTFNIISMKIYEDTRRKIQIEYRYLISQGIRYALNYMLMQDRDDEFLILQRDYDDKEDILEMCILFDRYYIFPMILRSYPSYWKTWIGIHYMWHINDPCKEHALDEIIDHDLKMYEYEASPIPHTKIDIMNTRAMLMIVTNEMREYVRDTYPAESLGNIFVDPYRDSTLYPIYGISPYAKTIEQTIAIYGSNPNMSIPSILCQLCCTRYVTKEIIASLGVLAYSGYTYPHNTNPLIRYQGSTVYD